MEGGERTISINDGERLSACSTHLYQKLVNASLSKHRSWTTQWWRYYFCRTEWLSSEGPEVECPSAPDTGPLPFVGLKVDVADATLQSYAG